MKLVLAPNPMESVAHASVVSKEDPDLRVNIIGMEVFTIAGVRVHAIPGLNNEFVPIHRENLASWGICSPSV